MSTKGNIKFRTLNKLFEAGLGTEKDISNMQIEDLKKIKNLSINDIDVIIGFKVAIKEKKFLEYLRESKEEQ